MNGVARPSRLLRPSINNALLLLSDNTVMRSLRRQTRVTGQPCTCDSRTQSCSCCGMIDEASTSFSARGCGTVRYGARTGKDSRLRYEVSVNDKTVGTRTEVAGNCVPSLSSVYRVESLRCRLFPGTRNPMELCVPAAFLTICTKFFNVEFQNATFTFCFRFDVKYSKFTLLAIDFDCVRASLAPGLNSKVQPPDAGFDPALLPGSVNA